MSKIIKIGRLLTNQWFFTFTNNFNKQDLDYQHLRERTLFACLFLVFPDCVLFQRIFLDNRFSDIYIDDALLIYPRITTLPDFIDNQSNKLLTNCKRTYYFSSIMLHRTDNDLKLSVHLKSVNKNDLINFFFHHSNRIKSRIDIG